MSLSGRSEAAAIEVHDTGAPISVPVGEGVLGRIFNVLGEPTDERGPVKFDQALFDPSSRLPPYWSTRTPSRRCLKPASKSST